MTDNTDNDVTRPISIIDRVVELLAPRDEVSRIVLRAAVVAAADVTHETGDPDTFAALLVDTVREAIGPEAKASERRDVLEWLRYPPGRVPERLEPLIKELAASIERGAHEGWAKL
jgi:hypothetical protein